MKIRVDGRKYRRADRRPIAILDHAHRLGMKGIYFRTLLDITPRSTSVCCGSSAPTARPRHVPPDGHAKVSPYTAAEAPEVRAWRRRLRARHAQDDRGLPGGRRLRRALGRMRRLRGRPAGRVRWTGSAPTPLARPARSDREIPAHSGAGGARTRRPPQHGERARRSPRRRSCVLVEWVGPDVMASPSTPRNVLIERRTVGRGPRVTPYVRATHLRDSVLSTCSRNVYGRHLHWSAKA